MTKLLAGLLFIEKVNKIKRIFVMDLYNKGLDFSPESFAIAKRRVCALRTEDTIKILKGK